MDTICGVGLPELIILALVSFVLIGPERSRDVALKVGRFMRTVIRSDLWGDFTQVAQSVRDLPTTLVRMAELEETQAELQQTLSELDEETRTFRGEVRQTNADLKNRTRRVEERAQPRGAAGRAEKPKTDAQAKSDLIADPWGIRSDTPVAPKPERRDPPPTPDSPDVDLDED
ncbi:MAG: hypothetical protein GYB68_01175 [Chloroflexi bacterium]|nr:hypothetical protein [Chloroflexota bacterium]